MRNLMRLLCAVVLSCGMSGMIAAQEAEPENPSNATAPESDAAVSDTSNAPRSCPEAEDWMTSASYMPVVVECLFGETAATADTRRVALVNDIEIKAWSYAWLNKITFWVAITLALCLLVWPSFVALHAAPARPAEGQGDAEGQDAEAPATKPQKTHWTQRSTTTSAIQTTLAALAALSFALYSHYKGAQVTAENLMREIIFAETLVDDDIKRILTAITEMDKGFGFTTVESLNSQ